MELINLQAKTERTYAIKLDTYQTNYSLLREFHYTNVENEHYKMLYYLCTKGEFKYGKI